MYSKMTTPMITPQQILDDRTARKDAGLVGCMTGQPEPAIDFSGYNDVQIWRPLDPKDPHCFCFDCRDIFDTFGEIDAELVNEGHANACYAYRNLVPERPVAVAAVAEQNNASLPPPGGDHGQTDDQGDPPGFSNRSPSDSNP